MALFDARVAAIVREMGKIVARASSHQGGDDDDSDDDDEDKGGQDESAAAGVSGPRPYDTTEEEQTSSFAPRALVVDEDRLP